MFSIEIDIICKFEKKINIHLIKSLGNIIVKIVKDKFVEYKNCYICHAKELKPNLVMDKISFGTIRKGDRAAFNELFKFYYPKLMAYCRLILEENIAKDVVQDTFIYIWNNRERIVFGKGFQSYLFQTVYSRSLDSIRKQKNAEKFQSESSNKLLTYELEWLNSHDKCIIEKLFSDDLRKKIEQILNELPEKRKEVFMLTYYSDLRSKEISAHLNMPKRTVESHLYLALKHLREKLTSDELLIWVAFLFFS